MSFVAIEKSLVCYDIQVGSVEQQGVKCSNDAAHENVARVVDTEINSAVGVNNCQIYMKAVRRRLRKSRVTNAANANELAEWHDGMP